MSRHLLNIYNGFFFIIVSPAHHLNIHSFVVYISGNSPPVLQPLPLPLRSFQGENLMYQLQAQDPEGSVLSFTLISGPEGSSLSPSGLLVWKVTAKTTDVHTFYFTVRDECNAETRASLQVRLCLDKLKLLLNPNVIMTCPSITYCKKFK